MKTILIRTMTIAVLATSISAFAQTGDTKREDWNTTQQNDSNREANDPIGPNVSLELEQLQKEVDQLGVKDKLNQQEKQKTNQEEKQKIRQDEKQWEHSLLGIYGG